MKPIEESADAHGDFGGDESTSVMGVDLLSSLTERSRRIDLVAPPVPEPEISIAVEQPEPLTPLSPAVRAELLVADGDYPAIGDDESTLMMDEPEPTTVAVRRLAPSATLPSAPASLPAPASATRLSAAQSVPDPQWAAELRVAPLPATELETTAESIPKPTLGSRRLSALAAIALAVAAWILGLGHH